MSSTDKTLMYPEARMHLGQLGFDQLEQTIDELVEGDYLRDYSTVVEFIDSTSDTVFHESIATKFNNPAFNTTTGGPTSTGSVGSGSAFDITPAYLKLFVWQRTE